MIAQHGVSLALAEEDMTQLSREAAVPVHARLLPLDDADICSLRDIDDADLDGRKRMKDTKYKKLCMKVAEGHISLSWIWKVVGISADGDDEELQEGLQEGEYLLPGRRNHIGSARYSTVHRMVPCTCTSISLGRRTPSCVGRVVKGSGDTGLSSQLVGTSTWTMHRVVS